jgi:hypothetical protein|tara:strand:- start:683 stop:979 length:297 start_codon:yes stop_codon:yes gene_type:complete
MQKKLLISEIFLYTMPMSDLNQTRLPFSAAKLLIKICRPAASVEGTEDALYPNEWALQCQSSDSRDLLTKLGLITCFAWVNQNHYIPTEKGLGLYFEG